MARPISGVYHECKNEETQQTLHLFYGGKYTYACTIYASPHALDFFSDQIFSE